MKSIDAWTLAIALAGLGLGLRSAWRDYQRDRPRLRVVPKVAYPFGGMPDPRPCLAFEIINDSAFPVTIDEVGILFRGNGSRGAIHDPHIGDKLGWPRRLEPRTSLTVYASPGEEARFPNRRVKSAYVRTMDKHIFRGRSPAFDSVLRSGQIPPLRRAIVAPNRVGYLTVESLSEN